jgi:hypothetical protein
MVEFRGRTAIRSSERRRAEKSSAEKVKIRTLENHKGCGTLRYFGAVILVISDIEIYVPSACQVYPGKGADAVI